VTLRQTIRDSLIACRVPGCDPFDLCPTCRHNKAEHAAARRRDALAAAGIFLTGSTLAALAGR
jgi:hypothetical protein